MTKYNICRFFVLMLAALLLVTGCGREESDETETAVILPAEPATGVGRVKLEKEVEREPAAKTGYYIAVDPGHGFIDGGTGEGVYDDGTLEKDINMAISKKLCSELEMLGFDVYLTHDGVTTPVGDSNQNGIYNITERIYYVNTYYPDLDYFISVHVNAAENPSTSGVRLYYYQSASKKDEKSEPIAKAIVESIRSEMTTEPIPLLYDQSDDAWNAFAAVRDTKAAASLIEVGFVTNETDAQKMIDEEWQNSIAKAIADGIAAGFGVGG